MALQIVCFSLAVDYTITYFLMEKPNSLNVTSLGLLIRAEQPLSSSDFHKTAPSRERLRLDLRCYLQ
jgi:hypothetical protein